MSKLAVVLAGLGLALCAAPAAAQVPRVFVSGNGNDGNACSFTAPCRTFQQAYTVAPANAEIDVLDPAGYGPLTISHGISIQGHGYGSITAANNAHGITINAAIGATILLNGLLLDGAGSGSEGITIDGAGSVQVVDCVIRHFGGTGLNYQPSNGTMLSVSNTIFADNGALGIQIAPGSGSPTVVLDAVTLTNHGTAGIMVNGGVVAVTDSDVSNNATIGFSVQAGQAMIKNSVLANNANGLSLAAGAIVWLARTAVYGNSGTGVNATAGTLSSYGDNDIGGNGTDVTGTLTPVSAQ
jgi:hypothetical protein